MSLPLVFFIALAVFLLFVRIREDLFSLPLVFHPLFLIRFSLFGLPSTVLETILWGVFLLFFTSLRWRHIQRTIQRYPLFFAGMVGFFAAATLSAFLSPSPHVAWGVWKAMVVEPIGYAFLLLCFLSVFPEQLERIYRAFCFGGLFVGLLSLCIPREGPNFFRFQGVYDVPNSLALVLAPLFVLILGGYILFPKNWAFHAVVLSLIGIELLATQSLAALFSVIVSICIVFLFSYRFTWKKLGGIVFFLFAGLFWQTWTGKVALLFDANSSSLIARLQIWRSALELVIQHPFQGIGLGAFEPAYQHVLPLLFSHPLEWVVRDPHMLILSLWLGTGIAGLLSFSLVCGVVLLPFFFTERKNIFSFLFLPPLLVLLLLGFFDVPYWKNDLALLFWSYLTCGVVASHSVQTKSIIPQGEKVEEVP